MYQASLSHRLNRVRIQSVVVILLVLIGASASKAQPTSGTAEERDRGIKLIEQGDLAEAVKTLNSVVRKRKNDIRAWHWLGVALEKQNNPGDARKAHEQAARIADKLQTSQLGEGTVLPKVESLEAAESAERYLALSVDLSTKKAQEWRNRADFLRISAAGQSGAMTVYKASEVTTKPRVISKPVPSYTEDARKNLVSGTVVLRVIFAADGGIRAINVVRGLPDGLTERAVSAAKKIKFIPATKDGRPVSMWIQLEYNFDLY